MMPKVDSLSPAPYHVSTSFTSRTAAVRLITEALLLNKQDDHCKMTQAYLRSYLDGYLCNLDEKANAHARVKEFNDVQRALFQK